MESQHFHFVLHSAKYGNTLWQNCWAVPGGRIKCCSKKWTREGLFPGEANSIPTPSVKLSKRPSSLFHGKPECALFSYPLLCTHCPLCQGYLFSVHAWRPNSMTSAYFCTETWEQVAEKHGPSDTGVQDSDSNERWLLSCLYAISVSQVGTSAKHIPALSFRALTFWECSALLKPCLAHSGHFSV